MADWACPRCGVVNLEGQRACEGCGRERAGQAPIGPRGGHVVRSKPLPAERPATDAQNKQAWRITMDVMEGTCSAEEGRRRLAELFDMPELEYLTTDRPPRARG